VILQQQTMWQSAHILALIQSQPMLTLFYHVRRKPHANCDRCFLFFCGMKITTYNFSFAFIVHCLDRFHKTYFDLEILLCAAGEGSVGRAHSAAISFVREEIPHSEHNASATCIQQTNEWKLCQDTGN